MPAITRGSDALLVQNPVRPARQITCTHPRSTPRVYLLSLHKKRKDKKCLEPAVREEALDESLTKLLQEYALSDAWKADLLARLEQDEQNERSSTHTFVASVQTRIASLQSKLQRLLDSYLDQDIDRDTYLDKKAEFMSEKKSLEEQSSKLTLAATAWVEPMRQWLNEANSICNLSLESDKNEKKVLAKEIFGSNLFLQNKKAYSARPKSLSFPLKTQWAALRAARQSPLSRRVNLNLAGTECEVANTSTPVFVITDKTLKSIEKLVENLKKLGIKDVNGELVYDEEEAGYEYLQ